MLLPNSRFVWNKRNGSFHFKMKEEKKKKQFFFIYLNWAMFSLWKQFIKRTNFVISTIFSHNFPPVKSEHLKDSFSQNDTKIYFKNVFLDKCTELRVCVCVYVWATNHYQILFSKMSKLLKFFIAYVIPCLNFLSSYLSSS